MKRSFLFLVEATLLLLGLFWLVQHPGHMTIEWLGYEVDLAISTFLILLLLGGVALWFGLSFLFWFFKIPFRLGDRYTKYHRHKGFEALYGALEARDLEEGERLTKEADQVEALLKEKELSLYLKGEAALFQKKYPLSEHFFYDLSQTKRGQITGLLGLLRVAEAQKISHQCWGLLQKIWKIAPSSRRVSHLFFEAALQQGAYDKAFQALKGLSKHRLVTSKERQALTAKAHLAKEKSLLKAHDWDGALREAREAYEAEASPETLKSYLPHLLRIGKKRKARKLLRHSLEETFDQDFFEKLAEIEDKGAALDKYILLKSFYDREKWDAPLLQALLLYALEAHLWGDAHSLLAHYRKTYGEDHAYLCLHAELSLSEGGDFKKALSFYQKAWAHTRQNTRRTHT